MNFVSHQETWRTTYKRGDTRSCYKHVHYRERIMPPSACHWRLCSRGADEGTQMSERPGAKAHGKRLCSCYVLQYTYYSQHLSCTFTTSVFSYYSTHDSFAATRGAFKERTIYLEHYINTSRLLLFYSEPVKAASAVSHHDSG
jgi:hypothetical protein